MIKLSNLKDDEWVWVEGEVLAVEKIKGDLERYRNEIIYTTRQTKPNFNAKNIIEDTVVSIYESGEMYEDWDERFMDNVTKEDIQDIQNIFDKMINRNLVDNTSYVQYKKIENDLLEELKNE